MATKFQTIGIIGKYRNDNVTSTLDTLCDFLQSRQLNIIIDAETAQYFNCGNLAVAERAELAKACELIIVVGGDGSLLAASRSLAGSNVPILGINRGHLGFLTDIHPDDLCEKVAIVLDGNYREEKRFLLSAQILHKNQIISNGSALNDVVLLPGSAARMIEFSIYIDEQFVCNQRADGLIVSTPTGSTAYALSGGGPIIHPSLDALLLVPMFPHTLSSRPIAVKGSSKIDIVVAHDVVTSPTVSCDGQSKVEIPADGIIKIRKKPGQLRLVHLEDYNFFDTLREKLHWRTKLW